MGKHTNSIKPWAVLFWLLVWQGASMALGKAILLPSPLEALSRLTALAVTKDFWSGIGWSALRILGGFFLGAGAGLLLAIPASRFPWVRDLLAPLMAAAKTVPVASFIILALIWLTGDTLSIFIAFLMVLPPVYLQVSQGIAATDRKLLEMAKLYRVPWQRQLWGIYVPQVLPYFRTAASLGLGLCWKAGIAAEVIGIPAGSLGERLYRAKVYFETADLFAWTAVIVLLSMAFERLFLRLLDHALFPGAKK